MVKQVVVIRGLSLVSSMYKILCNILLLRLTAYAQETGQLLIIYSAFVKYLRKNGNTMKQCIIFILYSSIQLQI